MKINYFACLIALFFAHYAGAHTASDSYLTIQDKDEHLSVQWDIALRDLDFALGLDINRDRQLTGAEIKTKADTITQYAMSYLNITRVLSKPRQQIVSDIKQPLLSIIKLVTCFTIAHSITLSLATLNIVTLPSRWVEVTIAASIVVVALNNIKPFFNHSRLWFAFLFGLVHGFGFANVLLDLNLQPATLALSLLSFNIGVEIGQVFIILLAFPLLYALSYWVNYRKIFVPTMSIGFSLVAMAWVIERSTGYMLLGI